MSNCSNHRKDVLGQTDMRHLAEDVGNLHYQALAVFMKALSQKLKEDSRKDWNAGRINLAARLKESSIQIKSAYVQINEAWQICKPHMDKQQGGKL